MSMQEMATPHEIARRMEGGSERIRLPRAAIVSIIAAIVTVTTTVVLIGGSEPASACFLGIPC